MVHSSSLAAAYKLYSAAMEQALTHTGFMQVIAHRLSTVQSADEVAVVSNGTIAERGSHADLLASGHIPFASLRHAVCHFGAQVGPLGLMLCCSHFRTPEHLLSTASRGCTCLVSGITANHVCHRSSCLHSVMTPHLMATLSGLSADTSSCPEEEVLILQAAEHFIP